MAAVLSGLLSRVEKKKNVKNKIIILRTPDGAEGYRGTDRYIFLGLAVIAPDIVEQQN